MEVKFVVGSGPVAVKVRFGPQGMPRDVVTRLVEKPSANQSVGEIVQVGG